MEIKIDTPALDKLFGGVEGDIASASTNAMRRASTWLKEELRSQIRAAGLGERLARTWQGKTYPETGASMTPAGYISSNAPAIIDSYSRGTVIRPLAGRKYLWIPTKNVPRRRGGVGLDGRNRRGGFMSPEDVENQFNTDFIIMRGRAGRLLAYIDVIRSMNAKAWRRNTSGRRAQGRAAKRVLMFILVKSVQKPRLLDLQRPTDQAADRYLQYLGEELGQ